MSNFYLSLYLSYSHHVYLGQEGNYPVVALSMLFKSISFQNCLNPYLTCILCCIIDLVSIVYGGLN